LTIEADVSNGQIDYVGGEANLFPRTFRQSDKSRAALDRREERERRIWRDSREAKEQSRE
jgi:hypothetical protein